jgi:hypothetical protein
MIHVRGQAIDESRGVCVAGACSLANLIRAARHSDMVRVIVELRKCSEFDSPVAANSLFGKQILINTGWTEFVNFLILRKK